VYLFFLSTTIQSQVGIQNTSPEAMLDAKSTDKGILLPRVDLTSLTAQTPIINPQGGNIPTSTLVYHNGTNSIAPGFYMWDGVKWKALSTENRGLQYFVLNGPKVPAVPTIEKSTITYTIVDSGIFTGDLDLGVPGLNIIAALVTPVPEQFMLYFTGTLVVNNAGNFQMETVFDDGAQIYIDNIPIINDWMIQGTRFVDTATVFLAEGKHKVEFWYFQNNGGKEMHFLWKQNANITTGIINPAIAVKGSDFIIN
jgi:hypothetical protein